METGKLINTIASIFIIGLMLYGVFLVGSMDRERSTKPPVKKRVKKQVKLTEQDTCNWCNVVKTYSLNVNSRHYRENTSK